MVELELVEELEAAAAPSPSDALLELAGLRTATRLTQLTYECDEGRVTVSEYVTLKNQHDAAADVCRICHGPGTVRPAEGDDETGVRLLRDTCLCRGSIGCVHEECLVRWYETAGLPPDPRCPTCRGQFRNEGGLVLSQPVWKSTSASGGPENSSLSHFSAMTRPCRLRRAVTNRHRHGYRAGVASRAWRTTRRFSTNAP